MKKLQVFLNETKETNFITCNGELVGASALDFKTDLKELAKTNKNLSIDLLNVKDISLTGLNAILIAKAYVNDFGKSVNLILPTNSKVLDHLHITKMTGEFNIIFGAAQRIAA